VWALVSRSRSMVLFAGLGFATLIIFAIFEPFLIRRFAADPAPKRFSANIEPEFNSMRLPPGGTFDVQLRITNTGIVSWANTVEPYTVSYRWFDPIEKRMVLKSFDFVRLPAPVRPNETVTMRVPFQVPDRTGVHLLTWEMSQG